MAKKTNPTPATKKPVTMADLDKRLRAVEAIARRQNGLIAAHANTVNRIERLLSTPQDVTGSPVTIPEQGLEPGDYTDASKEVADALTAMGWEWVDSHRSYYGGIEFRLGKMNNRVIVGMKETSSYPQAEFLSRASVTAKALRLVEVEPKPWKPEVGELITCIDTPNDTQMTVGSTWQVTSTENRLVQTNNPSCKRGWYPERFRPATPEEVAKYHADQEAAKAIVPYVTRVMCDGYEWRVICGMDQLKRYRIHRIEGEFEYCVSVQRHEFTVIDP